MGFYEDVVVQGVSNGLTSLNEWMAKSDDDVGIDDMNQAMQSAGMSIAQPTDEKPRAMFHDPYSVMDWGGWRQRPSSLTYETLRQMSVSNTVIAAIINLRVQQVGAFCRAQQGKYDKGYRVILRDRRDKTKGMSPAEMKATEEIERFLETTGVLLPGEKPSDRDSFRSFNKKAVRDILTYDQWCVLSGTMIAMADGTEKPIEAVQLGDRVVTHKGRIRRVTEVMSRSYTGPMYRFCYRGGDVAFTSGHPLLASKTLRGEPSWREAAAVNRGEYLTAPEMAPACRTVEAPWGVLDDDAAWVVGRYVADGFAVGVESRFSVSDEESLDRLVAWAHARDWTTRVTDDGAAWLVRLTGQPEWSAWLRDECGHGAGQKRVPAALLGLGNREILSSFLLGLLDGDGHWKRTGCVLSTTSKDLLTTLRLLGLRLGWYTTWSATANETMGWSPCWQARFSGFAFRRAMALAGRFLEAPDQEGRAQAHDGYHYLKINCVEYFEVEDEQVFNLEVEEDHSYLANGIVSHNCWEKIRDRAGRPSRFIALPSETIRPAVSDVEHMDPAELRSRVSHVQVYENTVIAEFATDDIAWCVQSPRSDLRVNGFGFSPIEQIVRLVTAWLFGFEYNTNFFTQGSAIKGLINIKGAIPDRQMRAFRRMWYSMITGVGNAWKTPILNAEDLQWVSMHTANREMEYGAWMDWLTKLICAVYGIDPIEINFIFGNSGQSSSLSQSRPNAEEVTESKDKGLKPLLTHIEDHINSHMIFELNPDFEFAFTGYDAKAEATELQALMDKTTSIMTIDEARAEMDMEPMPDQLGEIIRDTNWMQNKQAMDAAEQGMPPGMEGGAPGGGAPPFGDDGADDEDDEELMGPPGMGEEAGAGPIPMAAAPADDDDDEHDDLLAASLTGIEPLKKGMRVVNIWLPGGG